LQDFEELVLKDYARYNSLYGLEKFWAFHHYSGLPADNSVEVCPQLKALLEGPFKNLDCFREEQQRRRAALEVRGCGRWRRDGREMWMTYVNMFGEREGRKSWLRIVVASRRGGAGHRLCDEHVGKRVCRS
jgi:hypothetical protein